MKCDGASALIMKYLDGDISDGESKLLNRHIECCESCREEFLAYDDILQQFEAEPEIVAPLGFDVRVMARVNSITPNYTAAERITMDNFSGMAWGLFCLLFGGGVLLTIYREPILAYLLSLPAFSGFVREIIPATEMVASYTNSFENYISATLTQLQPLFGSARVVMLGLLAFMIVIQVVLYRKSKAKVEI